MNKELKNCPFCGSDNITKSLLPGLNWVVGCNNCGCRTPEYSHSCDAVSTWNRRVCTEQEDGIRSAGDVISGLGYSSMPAPMEDDGFFRGCND